MKQVSYMVRDGGEKLDNMLFAYDVSPFLRHLKNLTRRQIKNDSKDISNPRIYKLTVTLEEIK